MGTNTNPQKIKDVLTKGVEVIYPESKDLEEKMKSGERIRLYCGYDPSSPKLHLGHLITLKKLSQFQNLGHEVIMLIGDFTGMIGDPTEKLAVRKKLSRKEVLDNSKNYKKIAGKFLGFSGENAVKILFNSKWLDNLSFARLIELASNFTVQQMIIRDMFQERITQKKPIYLHEFLYPLAQAYDSVAMDVDLEVGGRDQLFNMLCGRDLMKILKNKEKFVLATKLLTDPGGKKMGKTSGNAVNLDDRPEDIYGKIMSWPDGLIVPGLELCTDAALSEIEKISEGMRCGKINPRDAKAGLAREIVSVCYDKKTAEKAEKEFNKIFRNKEIPSEIKKVKIGGREVNILDLLMKADLVASKSEAKRLIVQGGVKIDKKAENDWRKSVEIKKGMIIQAGKRKFAQII
ncbi:MAG: tyrosine--tRNA ligase [Patescibacteria group bacterium]